MGGKCENFRAGEFLAISDHAGTSHSINTTARLRDSGRLIDRTGKSDGGEKSMHSCGSRRRRGELFNGLLDLKFEFGEVAGDDWKQKVGALVRGAKSLIMGEITAKSFR